MELLSAPTRRGPVSWQWLLLAVSLLSFWSLPTTAQLTIESTNTAEGKDVILRIRNMPPDVTGFTWYRGKGAKYNDNIANLAMHIKNYLTGPAYSGREKINLDGSLQLKRVTQKDSGIYTVVVHRRGSKKEIGFGRLSVYEPTRVPTLLVSNATVTGHENAVVLTCYSAVILTLFFNNMSL